MAAVVISAMIAGVRNAPKPTVLVLPYRFELNRELAAWRVIKFREAVTREFGRLVRDGLTEPLAMTRPAPDCLASAGQSS